METQFFFKKLSKYCQSKNIQLLLVSYPELHQLQPYSFRVVTQKIKNMAKQQEVLFFDLLTILQGQKEENLWVSRQDQHPNSFACKLIAQAIKDTFENYFYLKKPVHQDL